MVSVMKWKDWGGSSHMIYFKDLSSIQLVWVRRTTKISERIVITLIKFQTGYLINISWACYFH